MAKNVDFSEGSKTHAHFNIFQNQHTWCPRPKRGSQIYEIGVYFSFFSIRNIRNSHYFEFIKETMFLNVQILSYYLLKLTIIGQIIYVVCSLFGRI